MKVGSLVECISTFSKTLIETNGLAPVKGGIYTVYDIYEDMGDEYYLLEEFDKIGWWIKKFKEIQPPMEIKIEDFITELQTA